MSEAVAITGLGTISALGTGIAPFWEGLAAGRCAIGPLGETGAGTRVGVGAQVPDFDPGTHFPADELPLLDRFSQFALLAAREAVADAGLAAGDASLSRAAAIVGSGCGGKQTDEETYARLYRDGHGRAHPLTIPRGMPSAAASMVSRELGIRGPVFTIASACASAAHAVTQGCLMIRAGLVDVALVGGTDAPFTYGLLKAWEALRVVSTDTCRPFSRDRSGMVLGEGAGMLLLESATHARRRGARVYAELAGFGLSSDAGHITRPDVEGIATALRAALEDAAMDTAEVDYVNAHGTGTTANDPAETEALHRVFGTEAGRLAVSSTKSMHGHALGASSALELVATVLCLKHGIVVPTANFTEAAEGCDLDYVPNEARQRPVDAALSSSFAFGGLNAVIALRSWKQDG